MGCGIRLHKEKMVAGDLSGEQETQRSLKLLLAFEEEQKEAIPKRT